MAVDTHAHLFMIPIPVEEIIHNAKEKNVNIIFNIGIDASTSQKAYEIAKRYKNIYFSAGIHPSEADNYTDKDLHIIESLLKKEKCIGIGETGLDFYREYSSPEKQKELFIKHLHLAIKFNKPVIIHSRNSIKKILQILNSSDFRNLKAIFHCFSYGKEIAQKILKNENFYISFAGNITYKNGYEIRESAKYTPVEKILVETDSPFLTPANAKSPNQPCNVIYVLSLLSKLKQIPITILGKKIKENLKFLYNF